MSQSHLSLLGKIAEYTEVLAENPRSTVFVPLSEAYRQIGMREEALQIVRHGVATLPRYSQGVFALGRLQAENGEIAEAVVSFERALALDSAHIGALKGLSKIRLQQGDKVAARNLLLRAAELQPGDEGIQKMLALLGPASPSPGAKKAGAPIATPTIADIYIRQGFPRRALKVYHDLLQADPGNRELREKFATLKKRIEGGDHGKVQSQAGALNPPADDPAPPPAACAPAPPEPRPSAREKIVCELDRWLNSIHRRREHVR
jgi:tetratricopeptide (TPR) repeat protein